MPYSHTYIFVLLRNYVGIVCQGGDHSKKEKIEKTTKIPAFSNTLLKANQAAAGYNSANWASTAELSPPESGLPQVTTDPSARIAANASEVA